MAKHPRVLLHFALTSASWLNLVEMCFLSLDHQTLRRGNVPNIDDLPAVIGRFCQSCNEHCQPFSWATPADAILATLNRQTNTATQH